MLDFGVNVIDRWAAKNHPSTIIDKNIGSPIPKEQIDSHTLTVDDVEDLWNPNKK